MPSAVVWSCHAWRYQFPKYARLWNWKREKGSTKETVGRVRKEGFGTIWLEKRGGVRSKEMVRAHRSKIASPDQPG